MSATSVKLGSVHNKYKNKYHTNIYAYHVMRYNYLKLFLDMAEKLHYWKIFMYYLYKYVM